MDYEKKYKEALERAKRLTSDMTTLQKIREFIFPELRESEDERIREFLIQHISEWIGCIEHDLKHSSKDIESEKELAMFKAGLAWLEKQKKQKSELPLMDGDTDTYFDDLRNHLPAGSGLRKEYKEYVEDDPVFRKLTNRNVGFAIARHFYELGLKSK